MGPGNTGGGAHRAKPDLSALEPVGRTGPDDILGTYTMRSGCLTCGVVVLSHKWPFGEWHHATPGELDGSSGVEARS